MQDRSKTINLCEESSSSEDELKLLERVFIESPKPSKASCSPVHSSNPRAANFRPAVVTSTPSSNLRIPSTASIHLHAIPKSPPSTSRHTPAISGYSALQQQRKSSTKNLRRSAVGHNPFQRQTQTWVPSNSFDYMTPSTRDKPRKYGRISPPNPNPREYCN